MPPFALKKRLLSIFCLAILSIHSVMEDSFAADSFANESPSSETASCINQKMQNLFFPEIDRHPKSAERDHLSGLTLQDLFPKSEMAIIDGSGRTIRRAKYGAKDLAKFKQVWDRLLDLRQDFRQTDARLIREGLTLKYGTPYPLLTPSVVENIYKGSSGNALTLSEIQDKFLAEYLDYKFLHHGDFSGWRKYLSTASPYSLTNIGIGKVRFLWDKTKFYIGVTAAIGMAAPIVKPYLDLYVSGFNYAKTKATEMLPERKELREALARNGELKKKFQSIDFGAIKDKNDRIQKWTEIESELKVSHQAIRNLSSKINGSNQMLFQSSNAQQLQASRQTFLTALISLSKDNTPLALSAKARALANLKALDLIDGNSSSDNNVEKKALDAILDQLADHPEAFQPFVQEFVKAQDLSQPQ